MDDENSALDDDLDSGWGDGTDEDEEHIENASQTTDDDLTLSPYDIQDAEHPKDTKPAIDTDEVAELKKRLELEQQRYKSAEGRFNKLDADDARFTKFSADMNAMRANMEQIQSRLTEKDEPADPAKAPEEADDDDADYRNPEFAKQYDPDLDAELAKRTKSAVKKAVEHAEKLIKPIQDKMELHAQEEKRIATINAANDFEKKVASKVDGFDELMQVDGLDEKLTAFIEAQSPALRRAYHLAFDSGTVDETADLLSAFKSSMSTEGQKKNPQQRDVKRKADAAAAVPSRRAAIPRDSNSKATTNDFDAGWNLEH